MAAVTPPVVDIAPLHAVRDALTPRQHRALHWAATTPAPIGAGRVVPPELARSLRELAAAGLLAVDRVRGDRNAWLYRAALTDGGRAAHVGWAVPAALAHAAADAACGRAWACSCGPCRAVRGVFATPAAALAACAAAAAALAARMADGATPRDLATRPLGLVELRDLHRAATAPDSGGEWAWTQGNGYTARAVRALLAAALLERRAAGSRFVRPTAAGRVALAVAPPGRLARALATRAPLTIAQRVAARSASHAPAT